MSVALQRQWTMESFLDWAEAQDERFEFDGIEPQARTGGNANHSRITTNLHAALGPRLRGTGCSFFGQDLGIATGASRIRFPDASITCTKFPGTERLAPNPVIVFEVLSPTSGRVDRIQKLREYQGVPSILRYVIVESRHPGLQVFHRRAGTDPWIAFALMSSDSLALPEAAVDIPVDELYQDVVYAPE